MDQALKQFHPAVASWFDQYFGQPTDVQIAAWQAIASQQHTLIAAPTGSGKTLAAFLASIDQLLQQGIEQQLTDQTQVLYISPLKALSNDIQKNLQTPLNGIRDRLLESGLADVSISAWVRTGDTSQSEREKMRRQHPHILVTTPESLFILLTSESGRDMLSHIKHVIVDEIHALAGNKRGAHLSLSLERLERLCLNMNNPAPIRIGISATQKPIETMADFLLGNRSDNIHIIDTGHTRQRDLQLCLPRSPIDAVMANEVWDEIYDQLTGLIAEHRTTLIFVNTRRLAERAAHHLAERLGEENVTSHHGSLSRKHRLRAEQRLKDGKLRAIVATASLELGIDIGDIDLVCQLGSPRGIATFLQRVGRSGHGVNLIPKGRLFPLTHNDLLECTALLHAIAHNELDAIKPTVHPLDVLAQQIVAEVAAGECNATQLYEQYRHAYPYRHLSREQFDNSVRMLSEGYSTRRGRRGAYLHRDIVNDQLRPRRGARLVAIMNGGAIPDQFDYDVFMLPDNHFVGTLNEDFAFESLPGDIFQLGNTSYRILKIESGKVFVEDAHGQPPNIPFWFGEAPGRSDELSTAVAKLITQVEQQIKKHPEQLVNWLMDYYSLQAPAAQQMADYLVSAQAALGALPSQQRIIFERFFDEAGDMHLVIHSPYGSRINRAWGLALRKRFCRQFNFELQAAATDNTIVLSLGATHSFPLDEVQRYLHSETLPRILTQALLDAPMFATHWRWNCNISLAVPRNRNGKRVPAQFQRSNAEDLIAVVFPDQLACLENIQGDREIPDHPLVQQTLQDCLHGVMDIDGLVSLYQAIESGEVEILYRDLAGPSSLCGEILTARPYAFLDDAPAEERRTQNVTQRRYADPSDANELGRLNPESIEAVKQEAWPTARDADKLYDALLLAGFICQHELDEQNKQDIKALLDSQRATTIQHNHVTHYVSAERLQEYLAVYPHAKYQPAIKLITMHKAPLDSDWARHQLLKSRLECLGPVSVQQLADDFELAHNLIQQSLLQLEQEGFAMQGQFGHNTTQWCERGLLARIHRYTLQNLRKQIEPVSPRAFMRFLFQWQHVAEPLEGLDSVLPIIEQLEGYPIPSVCWEQDVLPSRMVLYLPQYLDQLCTMGHVNWRRITTPSTTEKKFSQLLRQTTICLLPRQSTAYWPSQATQISLSVHAQQVRDRLTQHGACFYDELLTHTGLLATQLEIALAELATAGLVTSDSFTGIRAFITPQRKQQQRRHGKRVTSNQLMNAGRWSLVQQITPTHSEESIEHIARILLRRYGIVFRKLIERETHLPSWRELHYIYRRMEAKGEIRGGRFVSGFSGEQFALPEAITPLRQMRHAKQSDYLLISASDPLNLTGIITPGKRIAAKHTIRILYRDGLPIAYTQKGELNLLTELDQTEVWEVQNTIVKSTQPSRYQTPHQTGPY